jgi:hypothetical protein
LTTFISVKVDVVNVERGISNAWDTRGRSTSVVGDVAFRCWTERNVELDFMILESNKRKSKTRVSAEPELERNVKGSSRDGSCRVGKSNSGTNHNVVTIFLFSGLGKLVPNVEPVTIVTVDFLATNFNVDVVNKNVTNVSGPGNGCTSTRVGKSREVNLEVDLVN